MVPNRPLGQLDTVAQQLLGDLAGAEGAFGALEHSQDRHMLPVNFRQRMTLLTRRASDRIILHRQESPFNGNSVRLAVSQ